MSLRGSSELRTICEVLREINDLLQGHCVHSKALPKLIEAELMGKKMAGKLVEYNKDVFKDWWEVNPNYEENLNRRMNESYIS